MTARPCAAFLIWLVDSFGEREHALRFAAGLGPELEPVFLTPPVMAAHVAPARVRSITSVEDVLRALRELDPRLIMCSEFYNFPPSLRAALATSPWRLATFDGTSMGAEINREALGSGAEAPVAPDGMLVVKPCPINDPAPAAGGVFRWSPFRGLARGDGEALRRALAILPRSRIAFLAIAPWAVRAATERGLLGHYETLIGRLIAGFAAAGEETTLVVVSPIARPETVHRGVRLRSMSYLPRAEYEALLLGADLVISDNAIQTSIGKALVAGIPTLVLVNSRAAERPVYNIFPLELRLPADSAYLEAIQPVEIGEPSAIAARIAEAWQGTATRATAYLAALAELPSAADIVRAAQVLPG